MKYSIYEFFDFTSKNGLCRADGKTRHSYSRFPEVVPKEENAGKIVHTGRKRENREDRSDFRSKVSEKHTDVLLSPIKEKDERDRPASTERDRPGVRN